MLQKWELSSASGDTITLTFQSLHLQYNDFSCGGTGIKVHKILNTFQQRGVGIWGVANICLQKLHGGQLQSSFNLIKKCNVGSVLENSGYLPVDTSWALKFLILNKKLLRKLSLKSCQPPSILILIGLV